MTRTKDGPPAGQPRGRRDGLPARPWSRRTAIPGALLGLLTAAGCQNGPATSVVSSAASAPADRTAVSSAGSPAPSASPTGAPVATRAPIWPSVVDDLPGMPPVLDPRNIYAADGPNKLSPAVKGALYRVYVPNGIS
ncbi:MAG: hypothetical protein QOI76_4166, partial [Frankiales bacterium]|nr:hypothetical protein [Frankiales bacterium]